MQCLGVELKNRDSTVTGAVGSRCAHPSSSSRKPQSQTQEDTSSQSLMPGIPQRVIDAMTRGEPIRGLV